MALPIAFEHMIGTDDTYPGEIRGDAGLAETGYKIDHELSAVLWRGDDLSPVAELDVTWHNPAKGLYNLHITRADVAGLEPGLYRLVVYVREYNGQLKDVLDVYIRITAGPGSGLQAKIYGRFDDLLVYFPALAGTLPDSSQTGYREEMAQARRDVDDLVADHSDGRDKSAIRAILDADGLQVTNKVKKLAAYRALAIILGSRTADAAAVSAGRKSADQQAGADFQAKFDALAKDFVAEIDSDADGITDMWVDCREAKAVISTGSVRLGSRYHQDPEC